MISAKDQYHSISTIHFTGIDKGNLVSAGLGMCQIAVEIAPWQVAFPPIWTWLFWCSSRDAVFLEVWRCLGWWQLCRGHNRGLMRSIKRYIYPKNAQSANMSRNYCTKNCQRACSTSLRSHPRQNHANRAFGGGSHVTCRGACVNKIWRSKQKWSRQRTVSYKDFCHIYVEFKCQWLDI